MPGSIPPTSQLDWLISTTAMIVLFWSRATRDLLKSFGWGIAALHRLMQRRSCHPRRPPHSISPLEGTGFEPSVPLLQKALLGVANRDVGTISGTTKGQVRDREDRLEGPSYGRCGRVGTDLSNPVPSSGESVSIPHPLSKVEKPGFL